jgi:hypothetical protein
MNSRTQIMKCIKCLLGEGEHRGLIFLRDASFSLLSLCPCDSRDSSIQMFTTTPLLARLRVPPSLSYFMSHLVPLPLVLPPISYKANPLLPPCLSFACAQDDKRWRLRRMHHGALYVNQVLKPPLIMFRC